MQRYDHKKIEKKWQKFWDKKKLYETPDIAKGKKNFYLLTEFSYPSGNLHVGHWYAFAVPDILARALRMQGKNILYPTGFDAFGLPAENAAIKNKLNPRIWTEKNMASMKKQIESMGTSFDWSRQVITCDPAYYKWTQWLFLQFFKNGLAYRKETAVNWCPKDKTVLANEQVVNDKCERCDSVVVQKQMLQWNMKITDYADRLIDDLEKLDWPKEIKKSQRNWIGRSEGAEIDFGLDVGKKYKFVILHGYASRPDRPRYLWYTRELQELGHEVVIPALPHSDEPIEVEQVAAALAATDYDENTVLVGHSLGGIVAMKVLEKINRPIARLVLVAPAVNPKFSGAEPRPFWKDFSWDFDFKKISSLAKSCTVLSDLQEGTHRVPYLKWLAQKLNAQLVELNAEKHHFTGDKERDVLMWLRPTIRVFTTRADTLFGATYLVLAPEHPLLRQGFAGQAVENQSEVDAYIAQAKKKTELERQESKEKTGVELKGVKAINPATGKEIPLWVADYVLGHYGTGAIMAVPAHDERDFEFAKKFNLPMRQVVVPCADDPKNPPHAGLEEVKRDTVVVHLRDKSTNKFALLDWHGSLEGITTAIMGGIEDGQTPEQAALAEIKEEAAIEGVTITRSARWITAARYCASHKNQNRCAHSWALLAEIDNLDAQGITPEKEQALHTLVWVNEDEIMSRLTPVHQKQMWHLLNHDEAVTGSGYLVNSGEFDGMTSEEAKSKMTEKFGRKKIIYKLRDWIVSRQRYWGVPIPIIHCPKCGTVAVADKDLPVELPEVKDYLPEGSGKSPLAKVKKFMDTACPLCGGKAERETDTLDTFVDSSWYFLRYTDPKNKKKFADAKKMEKWMPVDFYSGGAEHTTMHVLYSRFWHKALFDLGLVKDSEPYLRRMSHGTILGPNHQKMSKSRGNVIDPDTLVEQLGADTVRMYLAFIGPYNEVNSYPWNPDGVVGIRRFLERVCRAGECVEKSDVAALESALHKAIKKVGEDIAALKFNTAISQLMILLNAIEKEKKIGRSQWERFLKLLAPFAPHIAEELWHELLSAQAGGNKKSVHIEPWPTFDERKLVAETITIAVQINGKTRGQASVPADASKETQEKAAKETVADRLVNQTITRTIVVPSRLVNFVVKE